VQAVGGAALSAGAEPPSAGPGRARPRAIWLLVGLATGSVLLDQLTKQLAVAHLAGEAPVRLLGGALFLVHTTNSGAAFNIGSSYTWVFPLVGFAVMGWIGWMTRRLRSLPWAVALGLVLGGAAGNLVDRLLRAPGPFRGEVVDMISVFAPDGSVWPVFNLADSSLVVGVVLAVGLELTGRHRDGSRVTSRPAVAEREG
jgi:signal peptidase II